MLPDCLKDLRVKTPRFRVPRFSFFLFLPFFSSLRGLHMQGYEHHRRPSRISRYSPCQHHRGAERLAEFHTLAEASQRLLWACPRNASWPQPQSLALTGSKERESEEGNTVIRSGEAEVCHMAALTDWRTYSGLSKATSAASWMSTTPETLEAFK